jgi:hypothetical protein
MLASVGALTVPASAAAAPASDTPHDWTPAYTLGPVPLRAAGAAAATVTYTVVAQ